MDEEAVRKALAAKQETHRRAQQAYMKHKCVETKVDMDFAYRDYMRSIKIAYEQHGVEYSGPEVPPSPDAGNEDEIEAPEPVEEEEGSDKGRKRAHDDDSSSGDLRTKTLARMHPPKHGSVPGRDTVEVGCDVQSPSVHTPGGQSTSNTRGRTAKRLKRSEGYVSISRRKTTAVDGNDRSCSQDALVACALGLGFDVSKEAVYKATLPPTGDTAMGTIIDYAKTLGIQMLPTSSKRTLGYGLNNAKGGPEFALLQEKKGMFFVELKIMVDGKPDDAHCVMYDADWQRKRKGLHGLIVDNEPTGKPVAVQESDRADKLAARKVWNSLFPGASSVRVVCAWLMRAVPAA